jgi:hypothetical protein
VKTLAYFLKASSIPGHGILNAELRERAKGRPPSSLRENPEEGGL